MHIRPHSRSVANVCHVLDVVRNNGVEFLAEAESPRVHVEKPGKRRRERFTRWRQPIIGLAVFPSG